MPSELSLSLLVSLALLAAACGEPQQRSEPSLLSTEHPIINGVADTEPSHLAVVALADGKGELLCSGTLVSRRVILTAAHCADSVVPGDTRVGFGNDLGDPATQWIGIEEVARHPDWDGKGGDSDIAVLRLAEAAPATVTPIPALPASLALSKADVGTEVQFSGFGRTETGSLGLKLEVSDKLDCICDSELGCDCGSPLDRRVAAWTLCYDQNPGGPCSGDSGGPAFTTIDGQEYVAGVTSYGDLGCSQFGCSTKVDRFEPFIQAFIGTVGSAPDGSPCAEGTECESGFCVDGICCNARCDASECEACSVAKGAKSDGACELLTGDCDDGLLCTDNDSCADGTCRGTPITCPAPDWCHLASSCDPATGQCLPSPRKPDGEACDDGDPCTLADACLDGICGGTPAICAAPAECRLAGVCESGAGCVYPPAPDRTVCSGGKCSGGACIEDAAQQQPEPARGCGCATADADPALLLSLLALALRRRRSLRQAR